jgi:hypothetical protein
MGMAGSAMAAGMGMMAGPAMAAGQQMTPAAAGGAGVMPQMGAAAGVWLPGQQQFQGPATGPSMMAMPMTRPGADKFRYPCKGCGVPGHWLRDGLCRPEDVADKMARDYAAYQQRVSQQQGGQEQAVVAVTPPGMNFFNLHRKCVIFVLEKKREKIHARVF